jgi:hypothetical protein
LMAWCTPVVMMCTRRCSWERLSCFMSVRISLR